MPPKLPPKDVWELFRCYVLGITDAEARGYVLQLMIRRRKEQGPDND